MSCARPVVFAGRGWVHRDPGECTTLRVAWPPPGLGEDPEDDGDADDGRSAA